ncbi:phBC6A51 family helix-turn-helix protein [Bacillus haynesii]|uniref:phBC6A51 family helix-turn-helix protein n=1 Tax=Bacillus haynesii TaxID=1925021 RepID=UPI00227F16F9|nr:phBC6A51 family helix-turn-helix protein [Bacillus haynesii]MCY7861595.1 phBC6A51 family helix-turn-helix protein [Bacillus haynesii]MCY9153915.1 phBC6A51 family helix-turn-helix protein [Bacillus haynesii]
MRKDAKLTDKQKTILKDYFQRSVDGENMEDIAKSYNISRKTLWTWKNTNEGQRLQKEWAKEMTEDAIPEYFIVLKEKALGGSYKHMELLAKLMDLFPATKQEITTNDISEPKESVVSQEMLDDIKKRLGKSNITRIK